MRPILLTSLIFVSTFHCVKFPHLLPSRRDFYFLCLDCIAEVFVPPYIFNTLSVTVQNSGKNVCSSIFVPNEEKSLWIPTPVITCLATVTDLSICTFCATEKRIKLLSNVISFLLDPERTPVHQVCKFAVVCS